MGAIRRLDRAAVDPQRRRGARGFGTAQSFARRPQGVAVPLLGCAREFASHRRYAARPQSLWPKPKRLRRIAATEMAVAHLLQRPRVEDRYGARIKGPGDLCRYLRRVPPWTGQRSRVRRAIPRQECLETGALGRQWSGVEAGT